MIDELYYNDKLYTFDNLYLFEDNTDSVDTSAEKDEFDIAYPAEATYEILPSKITDKTDSSTNNKLTDDTKNILNSIIELKK